MVTIKQVLQRKTSEGKPFLVLELEGGLEILTSESTGKPYATVKRCTIPCTMDESSAKALIGSSLPGRIEKVKCDPYSYQPPNSIEVVTLDYTYAYVDNDTKKENQNAMIKMSLEEVDIQ